MSRQVSRGSAGEYQADGESEVAQSSPTLRDPVDCSLPGSSVHGIFQARVLEWGAITFSEVLSVVRKQIQQERRKRLRMEHYGE